jgi:ABC-type glycerol-3-phosphate transport system substrate-binding protein
LLASLDSFANETDPAMGWDAAARADLYPFVQQAGRTPQGRLIGVPLGGDARMLLANHDWSATLEQPDLPEDWVDFGRVCEMSTDRLAGTLCYGVDPDDVLFEEWVEAHGTPVVATDGALQIASPGAATAIEDLLADLQTGQAYRATLPQRSMDDFAAARVMFAMDWSSRLSDYVDTIRGRSNFNLNAGTLPAPAGGPPVAQVRVPLWVLPRGESDTARDAWKFVNWLLEQEQTARWSASTGDLPARASAVALLGLNPALPEDAAREDILRRVAPYARPIPVVSGWPCVQDELADGLRRIFEGQPITDTLITVQARSQEVLNADCSAP